MHCLHSNTGPGRVALLAAAVLVGSGVAHADRTWTGNAGNDLWTSNGNWAGGGAPSGAINGTLTFGAEAGGGNFLVTGADGAYTDLEGILFTGANGAFTISGTGSLAFDDGMGITNDSTFLQTINLDLVTVGGETIILNTSSGNLALGGVISGAGTISKSGASTLFLTGNNTYSGGTTLSAGTIAAGHDSALGTGALSVTGNSTLSAYLADRTLGNDIDIAFGSFLITDDASFDLTLDGVISGGGGLFKMTGGTLTLNGDNTFTGGFTLVAGTLRLGHDNAFGDAAGLVNITGSAAIEAGAGGLDIANSLRIAGGRTLTISGTNDFTISGDISGSGALVKSGSHTLTLDAISTYLGPTTISAGRLVLNGSLNDASSVILADVAGAVLDLNGNDETIGSLSGGGATGGDVELGAATLTVGDATDTTYAGVISGAGGLIKQGEGTFTLTGDNTYTGATDLNAGAIILDGSIAGAVNINDGQFLLNGSVAGAIDVNGGQLVLDGTAADLVNVNDGGLLSGIGSVAGNLTNFSGGTIEPGNGIGTLTVGGDYDQQAGSTLMVEVNAQDGTCDLLDIAGAATLAGSSTIDATIGSPNFIQDGDAWTIIDADGGVTDNGVEITTDLAVLDFEIVRNEDFANGDSIFALQVVRTDEDYQNAAEPGNNNAVGGILDDLLPLAENDPTGEVAALLGQLDMLNSADYNEALSQLTPEPYDAATALGIDVTRQYAAAQTNYLALRRGNGHAAPAEQGSIAFGMLSMQDDPARAEDSPAPLVITERMGFGAFGQFLGIYSTRDTEDDRTGYSADSYGGQFGIDYAFSREWIAGLSLGYISARADLREDRGVIEADTFRIGPYATFGRGRWFADASASFGFSEYDNTRRIPMLGRAALSDSDGYDFTAYSGGGYDHALAADWTLTPAASLQYSYFDFDGFTERDAGAANLEVNSRTTDSLRSRVGTTLTCQFPEGGANGAAYVLAGWEHEFFGSDDIRAAFAAGGSPFTTATGGRDRDSVHFGAGLMLELGVNSSLFVRYDGLMGESSESHAASGGLSIRF